jgi:hypothetical protein
MNPAIKPDHANHPSRTVLIPWVRSPRPAADPPAPWGEPRRCLLSREPISRRCRLFSLPMSSRPMRISPDHTARHGDAFWPPSTHAAAGLKPFADLAAQPVGCEMDRTCQILLRCDPGGDPPPGVVTRTGLGALSSPASGRWTPTRARRVLGAPDHRPSEEPTTTCPTLRTGSQYPAMKGKLSRRGLWVLALRSPCAATWKCTLIVWVARLRRLCWGWSALNDVES